MGVTAIVANRLARLSPALVGVAARLLRNPFRMLAGKPLERQLLVYEFPYAQLTLANDLAVVDTLLYDRSGIFPKSTVLELMLRPLIGAGVFGQPGGDPVKQMRRVYVRALSRVADAEVERIARDLTREYVAAWQLAGAPVPIPRELSRLTIDIVTVATLGSRFTAEESGRFVELFFEYHKRANPVVMLFGQQDGASREARIDRMGLAGIGGEMRDLLRRRFLEPLLREGAGARSAPFAATLCEVGKAPEGEAVPLAEDPRRQEAMLDEIAVMVLAGHETTASVLSWLLWELAGCPELQETSANAIGRTASNGGEGKAGAWLGALIQESLRLYPPIAFLLRETREDVSFREKPIRADSFIVVSPWTIHRHRGLWRDPDAFEPERWMQRDPPPAMANRTAFIPFGQGPRVCPGKRFAEVEMPAILSEILGACRMSPTAGKPPRPLGSLTSRPDVDFRLAVAPRHQG